MINIYVAGKVKERFFIEYKNITYLQPFNFAEKLSTFDSNIYVTIDLTLLNMSDIILLVLDSNEVRNSLFEVGYLFAKNKPIIILDLMKDSSNYNFIKKFALSYFTEFQQLDSFIKRLSNGFNK